MADKRAITARATLRKPVGLVTVQLPNILLLLKVVANVVAHRPLVRRFPRRVVPVVRAILVFAVRLGTAGPRVEDLVGTGDVLRDDEAGVEVAAAEGVFVVVGVGVKGHSHAGLARDDAPVVHEPLKWQVKVVKDRIGVEVDTDVVLLEDLSDDWRFPP